MSVSADLPRPGSVETDGDLLERHARVVSPVLSYYSPLVVERASGVYLYTADRAYLDLGAGIATVNTGHCHPRVVAAAQAQLERLMHLSVTAHYRPMVELAERLAGVLPVGLQMFFFGNSGTEAIEGALKLARRATGRPMIIAFQGGFHGRTLGALAATSSQAGYRTGYQPLPAGIFFAPFPSATAPDRVRLDAALAALQSLFDQVVEPREVAAILVEPIQGEGGIIVPPPGFLAHLRELCDRHGIVLIFDEIQTGFGRTGRMFACQHEGIAPDLMALGKGIASGLPLSAIAGRRALMEAWPPGAHGTTFGGNPVSCAAAIATLEVLHEEHLVENAAEVGGYLLEELRRITAGDPGVADVRGRGLMLGIELRTADGAPDRQRALAVRRGCLERGVLILSCGHAGHVLRLTPPLVLTRTQADQALAALDEALRETLP